MNYSPAMQIVMNIAALEAIMIESKEIEPEHLFIALCKFEDLADEDLAKLAKMSNTPSAGAQLEVGELKGLFARGKLRPAQARRRMRRLVRKNEAWGGKFGGHRSQRCREVCHEAESRARTLGDGAVQARHYLWAVLNSDSHLIRQAVGELEGQWTDLCRACGIAPQRIRRDKRREESPDGGTEAQVTVAEGAEQELQPAPGETIERKAVEDKPAGEPAPKIDRAATPFLDKFGRDLTALAHEGKLAPCIGRADEMRSMAQVLRRKTKSNPVLVGDPGVGKTCIVEGLAQRAADRGAPKAIRDWRIVEVSMGSLIAGAGIQGQFEERLETMITEVRTDPNLILFIDELHTMVGAGGGSGKGLDAGQILKPALARGEIRVIGATTTPEYRKYIEPDAALERRFQMVWVNEPSREEAIEILHGLKEGFQKHHNITIEDEAIDKAVELSMRYLPDHRLPDKAIDLIDQACAREVLVTLSPMQTLAGRSAPPVSIGVDDIAAVISERCRIPIESLTADEMVRLLKMEEALRQRVMGQDHAIGEISDSIRTARAGLKDPKRPAGVFLFLGSTGTGKTELAKALAEFLFGDESKLIRFDMSEYGEKHNVSKLIGAPPGYIGHDEEGQLTGKVRTNPYSVLLFDEIEKAHQDVFDVFLQIFDEGQLTDSKGRRAIFRDCVIILTSNLGSRLLGIGGRDRQIGIDLEDESDEPESAEAADREPQPGSLPRDRPGIGIQISESMNVPHEKHKSPSLDSAQMEKYRDYVQNITAEVERFFRPELLNRVQKQIIFFPLGREVVAAIVEKLLEALNRRLADKEIRLFISPEAKEHLLEEGYSEVYGARELERVFDQRVATPLAREIIERGIERGQNVIVNVSGGELKFSTLASKPD